MLNEALQKLKLVLTTHQIVLLHPQSKHRTQLIASLLSAPPFPVLYHQLYAGDVSLDIFLTGLIQSLSAQHALTSEHLLHAKHSGDGSIDELAAAFTRDMEACSDDDILLLLDSLDYTDDVPAIQSFLEAVFERLPAKCHILINSRTVPRLPWLILIARGQAAIVRDGELLAGSDTGAQTGSQRLEIVAFSPTGEVYIEGQQVSEWEGNLPRLLLFYVLSRPGVTRAQICETFWPDLALDQAVNVFHVTKRRLHKAAQHDLLLYDGEHYFIDPQFAVDYDVQRFVDALVQAREGEAPEQNWQQAVELYDGGYLYQHDSEWIRQQRAALRHGVIEALRALGRDEEAEQLLESAG